jgi:hypothetical protein
MNQKTTSGRAAKTMEPSRRIWPKQAKPQVLFHLDMHADHRRWLGEHAMWRDDVSVWQKELDQAFDWVKGLKGTFGAHRDVQRTRQRCPCVGYLEPASAPWMLS